MSRDVSRPQRAEVIAKRVGDLWITVHPDHAITDAEWREHLDVSVTEVQRNGPYPGILVWAPKQGPSAHQRRIMTEEYGKKLSLDKQRACAVITDSALVRGIVTALTWFGAGTAMNAFSPPDVSKAFDWLALHIEFDRKRAEDALQSLRVSAARERLAAGG